MKFQYRQSLTKKAAGKYVNRIEQKLAEQANKPEQSYALNPTDEILHNDFLEKSMEVAEKLETPDGTEKIMKGKVKKVKKKPIAKKIKKTKSVKKKVKSS